jgi:hypothetical protein
LINPDLGQGAKPRALAEARNFIDELAFEGVGGILRVDELHAHRSLGRPAGNLQGDEGAGESPDRAEDQQRLVIDAAGAEIRTHAEQVDEKRDRDDDQEIGGNV